MTAAQKLDYSRRGSGTNAPATPIKKIPSVAEHLGFKNPAYQAGAGAFDGAMETWRKSLNFGGGGGGVTAIVSGGSGAGGGAAGAAGKDGRDGTDGTNGTDGVAGKDGTADGAMLPELVRNVSDGWLYAHKLVKVDGVMTDKWVAVSDRAFQEADVAILLNAGDGFYYTNVAQTVDGFVTDSWVRLFIELASAARRVSGVVQLLGDDGLWYEQRLSVEGGVADNRWVKV